MREVHLRILVVGAALAALVIYAVSLASAADVHGMNAKLAHYVHPTGKCGGAQELMITMYGNGDGHLGKPVACGGVSVEAAPVAGVPR